MGKQLADADEGSSSTSRKVSRPGRCEHKVSYAPPRHDFESSSDQHHAKTISHYICNSSVSESVNITERCWCHDFCCVVLSAPIVYKIFGLFGVRRGGDSSADGSAWRR